ncbi:MAG: TonB family protein, partial [Acidobacteriota bacterium]
AMPAHPGAMTPPAMPAHPGAMTPPAMPAHPGAMTPPAMPAHPGAMTPPAMPAVLPPTPATAPPKPMPAAPPPPQRPAAAPSATAPSPVTPPPPHVAEPEATQKLPMFEKMAISAPVFPTPAAQAPTEEEEPTDGTKFGQYVLLEKIATGGMAEVWKARMRGVEGFQKTVAIKKILPHLSDNQDFIEMFVDEAKLAAQLNHNNIIHIYDLGKIQSSYYIAMEYVDGYDLKTILRRGEGRDQPMQVELALFIASKVAAALDYAHRKHDFEGKDLGLVHRDVSPQNVLVSQDGDIKLCDFGIAKAASKANHTQAGALKGKLQYMSPEQAWGRNIDKRSDIFALATVLFEMLTGKKLFNGDNELSILEQVREARVTKPSGLNDEVPPEVDAIVLKALQMDPSARYQTAGEMAKDLDAVLYSIRPTPTSADLAIYMHRIWTDEVFVPALHDQHRHEPEPEPRSPYELKAKGSPAPVAAAATKAAVTPQPAVLSSPPMPAWTDAAPAPPAEKKKAPIVPIAIAAVVVLAAIGGFFAMRGGKSAPTPVASARPAPVSPPPSMTGTTGTLLTATSGTTATTATTATSAVGTQGLPLDQSKINEEVQKRLAAERAKLEQSRAQSAPPSESSSPRPTPAQQTATQAAAAQPVPAPAVTVTQAPPPPVEAPRTASAAPEPVERRVQTGDLVAQGSPGLVPAHMQRQAAAPYPPLAKMQKVQGSVILRVLVSETGQILETSVLSGVNRPGGLNEAAVESIRRSTFAPGTKDGVKVKSWTTVSVNFRL